jgi:hypothetical protein
MAKKKFDPKAKAKRQKVMLAVGSVLLLALLAFQVPRTMKMMKSPTASSSSSPSTTTTSAAGSTPLAPPSLDGSSTAATSGSGAASTASTSADGVSDPSNPLPPNSGQLVSFSKFKSKDPFHQQISDCGAESSASGASGCGSSTTPASSKPASTQKPGSSSAPSSLVVTSGSKQIAVKAKQATISVNGIAGAVTVGGSFPTSAPVFTLVSLTRTSAKIGIAGGSYENGAATVTLVKGKTVTLMNTADGARYTLRLLSAA